MLMSLDLVRHCSDRLNKEHRILDGGTHPDRPEADLASSAVEY